MARQRYEFKYRKPPRRRLRLSRVLMFLVLVALIAYPFYEAYHITIDEHAARFTDLPANLKNIRVVFVSDIHEGALFPHSRVVELVKTINGMSPDIVLFGGDYADDSDGAIAFFEHLPTVQARLGVFGVAGNHDRTLPESNLSKLMTAMTDAGVMPLVNTVARVKVGGSALYIAGSDDFTCGHYDVDTIAAQVSSDDFVIFLGHDPDLLTAAFAAKGSDGDNHWFDMALFGHTHGGQLRIFGEPLIRSSIPIIGKRYLSGWLEENRASILISNGIGAAGFPVRLFTPPQIHLITLKSK